MSSTKDSVQPNFQAYIVWFIVSLFYAYQTVLRNLPAIVNTDLQNIFQLSDTLFGQVRGIYFIGYCAMHLPMVYFLDRFGPKKVLTIAILCSVLGVMPMVWTESPTSLIIGRLILGVGSSAAILGVFKVNRALFPDHYFARMLGITAFIALSAGFLSMNVLPRILFAPLGYTPGIYVLASLGCGLAVLTFLLTPKTSLETKHGFFEEIIELFKNTKFLFLCCLGGFMIGALEGYADGWSEPFLVNIYNMTSQQAKDITSLISLGFAVGSPLLAFIGDFTGYYRRTLAYCALIMAASFSALFFLKLSTPMIVVTYFIIGFISAYQVLLIYLAGKTVPEYLANISGGGSNLLMMSFGYLFHSLIGFLMEGKGTVDLTTQTIVYSQKALLIGLAPLPILAFISYVLFNWTKKLSDLK